MKLIDIMCYFNVDKLFIFLEYRIFIISKKIIFLVLLFLLFFRVIVSEGSYGREVSNFFFIGLFIYYVF